MNLGIVLKLTIVATIISCCSCSRADERSSVILPLYAECLPYAHAVAKSIENEYGINNQAFSLKVELFDEISQAHSSVIGFVEWLGTPHDSDFHSLEVRLDGYKLACLPGSQIKVPASTQGVELILDQVRRNEAAGIDNNYISISDGELSLHYNDGSYRSRY